MSGHSSSIYRLSFWVIINFSSFRRHIIKALYVLWKSYIWHTKSSIDWRRWERPISCKSAPLPSRNNSRVKWLDPSILLNVSRASFWEGVSVTSSPMVVSGVVLVWRENERSIIQRLKLVDNPVKQDEFGSILAGTKWENEGLNKTAHRGNFSFIYPPVIFSIPLFILSKSSTEWTRLTWFAWSSKNEISLFMKRESVLSVTLVLETMKRDIETMETSLTEISTITSGWNELLKSRPTK